VTLYYDFTVPVPNIQGKIYRKPKGGAVYILFQYGQKYNKEKQYSVPQRTIIEKVHGSDKTVMYPNEKYEEFFPNNAMPEELPDALRSCALRIGTYAVIQKVITEYKLKEMLSRRFGEDTGLLLDLVAYMIVDEENAGQYYPDFAFCHPLFSGGMRIYSDSKVSRFLNAITKNQTIGFLDDWNRKRDHKQRIYISYESSNKNCQAGDIDLIEYGKTVKSKLYEDDSEERFFHIYFNPSRQAAEREQLEVKLDKFKLYMDKYLGEEITLGKTYHHYFQLIFDKKGRLLSYKERNDVIQREL
jgi:hypothetical protein